MQIKTTIRYHHTTTLKSPQQHITTRTAEILKTDVTTKCLWKCTTGNLVNGGWKLNMAHYKNQFENVIKLIYNYHVSCICVLIGAGLCPPVPPPSYKTGTRIHTGQWEGSRVFSCETVLDCMLTVQRNCW